jgi:uncharacterized protein YfdQ (DUF2303 family)
MADVSENQAIIDIAQGAAAPEHLDTDAVYGVTLPAGARYEVIDLERFWATPRRPRARVTLHTANALAAYVGIHKQPGTALYADDKVGQVVAVLDDNHALGTGWRDHVATLKVRKTPTWERWYTNQGLGRQDTFAENIEAGLKEITDPPAADMLELAQNFEATVKADFHSCKQLASGQRQFGYDETVEARAGQKGTLTVPAAFTLTLQPYEGGKTFEVTARLRYRIEGGKLSIGYHLDRSEDALRQAWDAIVASIEEATSLTCYAGQPPA